MAHSIDTVEFPETVSTIEVFHKNMLFLFIRILVFKCHNGFFISEKTESGTKRMILRHPHYCMSDVTIPQPDQ